MKQFALFVALTGLAVASATNFASTGGDIPSGWCVKATVAEDTTTTDTTQTTGIVASSAGVQNDSKYSAATCVDLSACALQTSTTPDAAYYYTTAANWDKKASTYHQGEYTCNGKTVTVLATPLNTCVSMTALSSGYNYIKSNQLYAKGYIGDTTCNNNFLLADIPATNAFTCSYSGSSSYEVYVCNSAARMLSGLFAIALALLTTYVML